ncbi:MAG: fibrinogen-like YCDxxxxGGGW domain-containing protein [Candidatus Aureabacteria bacterium]|nr:fibrinogen-like YCDxxxxGGGW domain-containing protein [Candidatus Auribacterota bacterium]
MKNIITIVLSMMLLTGMSGAALAGSLDSPGAPSAGSGMYTLQNLYDYIVSGSALEVQSGFQEPTSGPGSTMKTTKEIGDMLNSLYAQCPVTTADVKSGVKFFCTQAGSWGVQTGMAQLVPTPTPTITSTPTITPYGYYVSCKAIKTATPSAADGLYAIDPDGPSGNAPFNVYCDMTTDDGGWTLVARLTTNDANHYNTNAVGSLTSPTQSTTAKLSDAMINQLATQLFRFSCESVTDYFDASSHNFGATNCSSTITTVKDTYSSTTWSTGDPGRANGCGLDGYPNYSKIVWAENHGDIFGCYAHGLPGNGNGVVWGR